VHAAAQRAAKSSRKQPASTPTLQAFPLADVRVLEGPFLEAQQRDEAYLLKLEVDRLLHNFRVNAGLEPKAAVYGGWESVQPWVDIRCQGHARDVVAHQQAAHAVGERADALLQMCLLHGGN